MAEFEDKLGAILNDPQAMGQIMALAKSIGGGEEKPAAPTAPTVSEPGPAGPEGLDPRLMEVGMRALAAYQDTDDRKTALLLSLKPFLQEKRYKKVDKAIQIARVSKAIRAALDSLKGGENPV